MAVAKKKRTKKGGITLTEIRNYERSANALRREIARARVQGVGLLTPGLINKHLADKTDVVLAYGRKGLTQTYTLDDLRKFNEAIQSKQNDFQRRKKGVPLLKLEASSLPIDKQRAKTVKNSTLYRIDHNLLYFRVTGNVQPYYQVRIRLENWDEQLSNGYSPMLQKAKTAAMGNISIDCQCGRHQYWYRYLANIGGFDVAPPKEQDFPKIRNPKLTGCCCKHVLKTLSVLKSPVIQKVLAKEIERQSHSVGFADRPENANKYLDTKQLKSVAKVKGVTSRSPKEARTAFNQFLKDAREALQKAAKKAQPLKEKLTPRQTSETERRKQARRKVEKKPSIQPRKRLEDKIDVKGPDYQQLLVGIKGALMMSQNLPDYYKFDDLVAPMAKAKGLEIADIREIMKRENIHS